MTMNHTIRRTGLAVALLLLGACKGDFFAVESPGKTADEDLNDPQAFPALVTGMSFELTNMMDDVMIFTALASLELWHGGSYDWGRVPRGIILPEDVNGEWSQMHEARWVAEDGIERMRAAYEQRGQGEFDKSPLIARAFLLAGLANRTMGEMACQITIDAGPAVANTEAFVRAEEQFREAIRIGTTAGEDVIVSAAYGGLASVLAWQGDWAGADAAAQQVDGPGIQAQAIFSDIDPLNDLAYETHSRNEYTVFSTEFAEHYGDPRLVWDTLYKANGEIAVGANGATPMFQQNKYETQAADIPLVKGTEMLVLRAEAALRNGDIPGMTTLLNEARAFYGMAPLAQPASEAEAWTVLQFERGATLWLEARRLWDIRRWTAQDGPAKAAFLATHPEFDDPANPRQLCLPFSEEELDTNPNLTP